MSSAIHDLINAVRTFNEAEMVDSEPDNMATNIIEVHKKIDINTCKDHASFISMKVHRKLAPDSRYFIGSDLDHHLDSILQNSMAVAHVSRERYKEVILRLCSEVISQLLLVFIACRK